MAAGGYDATGAVRVTSTGAGVGSADTAPTSAGSYQQLTPVTASTALPSIPTDATSALVVVSGQPVRWRADGTAPTATVGMPVAVGGSVRLFGAEIAAARFIQTAVAAILDVYYSR